MPIRLYQPQLAFVLAFATPLHLAAQPPTFYAQTISRALLDPSSTGRVEVLLYDLHTREMLIDNFRDSDAPIPVGSLLKPFLALAWLQAHSQTPQWTVVCHGHSDRCWRASGHGRLTLAQALAQSCNAYFLALAAQIDPARIPYLPQPPAAATPDTLIGLTPEWLITPRALLKGYAMLLSEPLLGPTAAIRQGMALSATNGTAAHVGSHTGGVLAKTGTAPCVDPFCAASGDGLVVAAVPARHPTLLLLVRRRATTGAGASADAGRLLSRLEALHAY